MLNKLVIQNFKAISHGEIILPGVTLLAGKNGMGKSSVIQILLLLRQSLLSGDLANNKIILNGSLISLGKTEDVISQFGTNTWGVRGIQIALKFTETEEMHWFFQGNDQEDFFRLNAGFSNQQNCEALINFFSRPFWYLNAERISPQTQYSTVPKNIMEAQDFDTQGRQVLQYLNEKKDDKISPFVWHESVLERVRERRKKDPSHPDEDDLMTHVIAWMDEISPGIAISTNEIKEVDALTLRIKYDAGGIEVPFTREFRPINTGFGITYALPVVITLLAAQRNELVIIENPEAHLHPRGQSRIGLLITLAVAAGVQVIVETHSDHVLNGIRLGVKMGKIDSQQVGIYYFDREKGDSHHKSTIKLITVNGEGRLSEWPIGFFDEWANMLDELI